MTSVKSVHFYGFWAFCVTCQFPGACYVRVWNYEEDTLLNSFDNHDYPDKGISRLRLINELDENLLLVASSKSLTALFK